jgi:hypothetical protein
MHPYHSFLRAGKMLKNMPIVTALALLSGFVWAQSTTRPKYLDHAMIQHSGEVVTVTANSPVPLFQVISGIREEYGWRINWESAPGYSRFDLVDDTGPKWRAAHPDAKGVTRPAGGVFVASFPEPTDTSAAAERDVLEKVIQEYNATENPGKYALRADTDGQFAVVGTQVRDETGALRELPPLLDTPVSMSRTTSDFDDAIRSILAALQSATGTRIVNATFGRVSGTEQVTVGGERLSGRNLLNQALASTKLPLQYDLLYDADLQAYGLTVSLATR